MTKYLFVLTLLFNLGWVSVLLALNVKNRTMKHYLVWLTWALWCLLGYEIIRELSILWRCFPAPTITPFRVHLYAVEHVLLGIVGREALYFYEKAHHTLRKRLSCRD